MKITVQSIGLTPHEPLESHIEKKVSKLETFYDKIHECKVFLKVENAADKINKTTELILAVPGDDIVVKKTSATFEESLDLCVDTAKKLLIKKKELAQKKKIKKVIKKFENSKKPFYLCNRKKGAAFF